jgi:hypothetical protein
MGIAQTIDVEQLLIWAYRDECVAYGDNDRGRAQVANRIYFMGGLGTLIDGDGRRSGTVPEDALTVEAAVAQLTGYRRDLVSMHATAGTRPSVRWERPPGVQLRRLRLGNRQASAPVRAAEQGQAQADRLLCWLPWRFNRIAVGTVEKLPRLVVGPA